MKQIPEQDEIKALLDERYLRYNTPEYIETDPIQIPHRYSRKEDVEIAAFLTATIAWGQRKAIIKNASFLMELMENTPYDFCMNASRGETDDLRRFVHRTFNGMDCEAFIYSLRNVYRNHGGLESVFNTGFSADGTIYSAIRHFRTIFLETNNFSHSYKHVSDVTTGSAAKRINMLLRWLVRKDEKKVDFGIWHKIPMSALMLPLDVHAGDVSRALGLLNRKQNDWKALEEVMIHLRRYDPADPVKYDYALFGIGVFENKKDIRFDV